MAATSLDIPTDETVHADWEAELDGQEHGSGLPDDQREPIEIPPYLRKPMRTNSPTATSTLSPDRQLSIASEKWACAAANVCTLCA